MHRAVIGVVAVVALVFTAPQLQAQGAEGNYHKAYYLETAESQPEQAIPLYEKVAADESAPAALREQAKTRLARCRETVQSRELARLMPADALAYLEVRRPGEHLARLVEMAGLTESEPAIPGLPVTVSPRLLEGLKRAQGAALCVTNVDARFGVPSGVVVLNLGRDDLTHGLVETALSSAVASNLVQRGETVHGHPSFIGPFVTVVTTETLVIAGNPQPLVVEAVERRHQGGDAESLANSPVFRELAAGRESSLLFAFANTQRALAIAKAAMNRYGEVPEEYMIAQAFGDIESCQWAAASLGLVEQGLTANVWLRLDDDNNSLAYHMLRTSPMDRAALGSIPAGAAAFAGLRLAEGASVAGSRSTTAKQLTGLDIGRELFANVQDVLAFIVPPAPQDASRRPPNVPDVGLVLTSADPSRSRALWTQILGIAATMTSERLDATHVEEVDGQQVHIYEFPDRVRLYLAPTPKSVVLASSRRAIAAAVKASSSGESVLEDPAFAGAAGALNGAVSKLVVVSPSRMVRFMQPLERIPEREAAMLEAMLENATAVFCTREAPASLHASASIGLPEVAPLIAQLMNEGAFGPRRGPPIRGPQPGMVRSRVVRVPPTEHWDPARVRKFVPRGSEWKYSDDGTAPAAAWRAAEFDDGVWQSGAAPLGYGDEGLATTVASGEEFDKHITTFFRRTFQVDNPGELDALRIRMRRDDGAVVYVNGTAVARDNMPPESDANTPALMSVSGPEETIYIPHRIPPNVLRPGKNVIAIEVHQSSGTSSDVVFDLELEGRTHAPSEALAESE